MSRETEQSRVLEVEGIDHVSLNVADPARSEKWYQTVLGLERRFEQAWGDVPRVLGRGTTNLAFFAREPNESGREPLAPGSGHIAFRVDAQNFELAPAHLGAHGIRFRRADYGISRSLHFEDPDGYHLEITTYDLRAD